MRFLFVIIITVALLFQACTPSKVQEVIKLAGRNGVELQNVLAHYSKNEADSLKFKAAVFLIENMCYHYGTEQAVYCQGQVIDSLNWSDHGLDHVFVQDHEHMMLFGRAVDSLDVRIEKEDARWDMETITAAMLIENIEYAFKALEMPWCKHLSFDEFCEYILPYRCQTEPLTHWRKYFYEKYSWIRDSLPGDCKPLDACIYLQDILKNDVFYSSKFVHFYSGFLPPRMFEEAKVGACENLTCYTSLVMRAVGIPVLYDQILYWSGMNVGHGNGWIITNDSIGGYSMGVTDGPPEYHPKSYGTPKVFRKTFKTQNNPLWSLVSKGEQIAPGFMSWNQIDVTDLYCMTDTLTIQLNTSEMSSELYWLCQINREQINAVNYSFVHRDGKLYFPKTTKNLVYTIGVLEAGDVKPVGNPFISNGKSALYGELQVDSLMNYEFEKRFLASTEYDPQVKERSFNVAYWNKGWHDVSATGKLVKVSTKNNKEVVHYNIQLTNVPKGALFISEKNQWFTFNEEGEYQKI